MPSLSISLLDRALIIDTPYIDMIMRGDKIWEMRTSRTHLRGLIGLIRKGSGQVVGIANLVDSHGPLSLGQQRRHANKSRATRPIGRSAYQFAWELADARALPIPVTYRHPSGAVIWVNLSASVTARIMRDLGAGGRGVASKPPSSTGKRKTPRKLR